jgi:hypothetical protein
MARVAAAAIALVLLVVLLGDRPAQASGEGEADPPLTGAGQPHVCCVPPGDYRSRTQFVTEMLRSVEAL